MKGLVVALALCAVSCTVNRKSEQFACFSNAECTDGRTCNQGFCVTDGSGSDPACASQCSSCDHSTNPPTCVIDGGGGASIDLPAGRAVQGAVHQHRRVRRDHVQLADLQHHVLVARGVRQRDLRGRSVQREVRDQQRLPAGLVRERVLVRRELREQAMRVAP